MLQFCMATTFARSSSLSVPWHGAPLAASIIASQYDLTSKNAAIVPMHGQMLAC